MSELSKDLKEILKEKNEKIVASNIKAGVQIFDVVGGYTGEGLDTTDATATEGDVLKDKTYYANGVKHTGTLVANPSLNVDFDLSKIATSYFTGMSGTSLRYLIKKVDCTNSDLSAITSFIKSFAYLYSLTEVIGMNIPNVTNFTEVFSQCSGLEKVELLNTGKIMSWSQAFSKCTKLNTLSELDGSSANYMINIFLDCTSLENFGGFKNLGKNYGQNNLYSGYKLVLGKTILTHESLMNVINGLYDLNLTYDVANGGTLYTQSLNLGSTNLAKLTEEEIAIATNKRLDSILKKGE